HTAQGKRARTNGARGNGRSGDHVERPHRERDQVRGERLGRRKGDSLEPLAGVEGRYRASVADRFLILGHEQGDIEGGLERRLIETRKRLSAKDRFELSEGVGLPARSHAVKPLEMLSESRIVIDSDGRSPWTHRV